MNLVWLRNFWKCVLCIYKAEDCRYRLSVYEDPVPVQRAYRSSCLVCLRDSFFSGDWLPTFCGYHAQSNYLHITFDPAWIGEPSSNELPWTVFWQEEILSLLCVLIIVRNLWFNFYSSVCPLFCGKQLFDCTRSTIWLLLLELRLRIIWDTVI